MDVSTASFFIAFPAHSLHFKDTIIIKQQQKMIIKNKIRHSGESFLQYEAI